MSGSWRRLRALSRTERVAAGALVASLALAFLGGRGIARPSTHAASLAVAPADGSEIELRVPRAGGEISLDGDTDDPGWQGTTARTGAFVTADDVAARPHSEARFVWGDGHLFVELYAADEDIRAKHETADGPVWTDDAFHLVFSDGVTERSFDVSPLGALTDGRRAAGGVAGAAPRPFDYSWNSGAHVSHELDGTPNDATDDDEEWVIEMAIPFEALGLQGEKGERIGVWMRRCDTVKSGERSCGTWGSGERRGTFVLD